MLNFAHGDVLMLSSFAAWYFIVAAGLSFWLALPLVVLLAALLCWLLEARVMRAIVGQPQFAGVMLTIGIGFMIRGGTSMVFGPDSRSYPTVPILVISIVVAVLVAVGAAFGGTLVFDYGFNVETAGDSAVWHRSETDVLPGDHGADAALADPPPVAFKE